MLGVSVRAAQRAVAAGRLRVRGTRPNRRGKPSPLFALADLQRLTKTRGAIPTWKRFDLACRSQGANPVHVLCQFLQNSQFDSFDGQRADLDLFHIGIRLTLETRGEFVGVLMGQVQSDHEFDRRVATVLGNDLDVSRWGRLLRMSCRELWGHLRHHARDLFGHNAALVLRTDSTGASRLSCRPRYLTGIGRDLPTGAFESIARPDRQKRQFYATAERDLGKAIWSWRDGKPSPQHTADFLAAMASARAGDIGDAVRILVSLGLKRLSARAFAEAWQRSGQFSRVRFDRATVNRIFCQSRAA